jgi:hypothetical protein
LTPPAGFTLRKVLRTVLSRPIGYPRLCDGETGVDRRSILLLLARHSLGASSRY